MFHLLENRRLLSGGPVLNNGMLHVHGTPQHDHIHINLKADGLLHVVVNGKVDKFQPSEVLDIVVDGGDGDDLLELVKAHVVANVRGGNGNDKIRVFSNSKIDGGDGIDAIECSATDLLQSVLNVEAVELSDVPLLG